MPIVGGIAGFALLFGVTWILASTSTNNRRSRPESIPQTLEIGKVTDIAKTVDEGGPIWYPDVRDAAGRFTMPTLQTVPRPAWSSTSSNHAISKIAKVELWQLKN